MSAITKEAGEMNKKTNRLVKAYCLIKKDLYRKGFFEEIEWQYNISRREIDQVLFMNEASWVILNTGMKEYVVRKKFSLVVDSFRRWTDFNWIVSNPEACETSALKHFNNQRKIHAIVSIACDIQMKGFSFYKNCIKEFGCDFLASLPHIGPVTSLHFGKNIGLNVFKPDRHMNKISSLLGFPSPKYLCDIISSETDDPIPVVDIVIWRFCTIYNSSIESFAKAFC